MMSSDRLYLSSPRRLWAVFAINCLSGRCKSWEQINVILLQKDLPSTSHRSLNRTHSVHPSSQSCHCDHSRRPVVIGIDRFRHLIHLGMLRLRLANCGVILFAWFFIGSLFVVQSDTWRMQSYWQFFSFPETGVKLQSSLSRRKSVYSCEGRRAKHNFGGSLIDTLVFSLWLAVMQTLTCLPELSYNFATSYLF